MRNGYARAGRLATLAAGVIVVVAACGGGATPSPAAATKAPASLAPSQAPSQAPSVAPSSSPAPSEGVDEYQVTVATSATAGKYLAGKDGLALYIFKKDTGSTSTCYDACATAWPPFVVTSGDVVKGEDGVSGAFATTDRTDGTRQVTYNGAPLYFFQGDKAAGDTTGQGLNDVWFVAAP